ncbi:MAG: hypothetical protein HGA45_23295 [Chloroflexales bacterium]|nr:hypothetical protein [Chloroflexales bacterium]
MVTTSEAEAQPRAGDQECPEAITLRGAPRDLVYDPDVAQEVGAEEAAGAAD